MNIRELGPQPAYCETFRRNLARFVPEASGCYVLTTFSRVVLYIGQTANLRRRMNEHLDNPKKTAEMELGRAVLFFWIVSADTDKIERTWLNTHIQCEGTLPMLNSIYAPTST